MLDLLIYGIRFMAESLSPATSGHSVEKAKIGAKNYKLTSLTVKN